MECKSDAATASIGVYKISEIEIKRQQAVAYATKNKLLSCTVDVIGVYQYVCNDFDISDN
jgi:hypothetical protein